MGSVPFPELFDLWNHCAQEVDPLLCALEDVQVGRVVLHLLAVVVLRQRLQVGLWIEGLHVILKGKVEEAHDLRDAIFRGKLISVEPVVEERLSSKPCLLPPTVLSD